MRGNFVPIVLSACALLGCAQEGMPEQTSREASVMVELLRTHETCKTFRLEENGQAVTWTRCTHEPSKITWNEMVRVGKALAAHE